MENKLNNQYEKLIELIKEKQIFKSNGGFDDKIKITEFPMSIKDYELNKKAIELFYKFGQEYAIKHINEVILLLESIPKLTVCEIEGQKCYGIIDFYKELSDKIKQI